MIGDDVLKAIAGIRGGSGQGFVQDASRRINVGRRRRRLGPYMNRSGAIYAKEPIALPRWP